MLCRPPLWPVGTRCPRYKAKLAKRAAEVRGALLAHGVPAAKADTLLDESRFLNWPASDVTW